MEENKTASQKGIEMLLSKRLQLILTLTSLLVLVGGIYLTAQLAPLYQDIALNRQAVADAQDEIKRIDSEHGVLEIKIDKLLEGQARLEGILLGK